MALTFVTKITLGSLIMSGGVSVIGVAIYSAIVNNRDSVSFQKDNRISFFTNILTGNNTSAFDLMHGNSKNYKCKFEWSNTEAFDCTITQIKFDTSKKYSRISELTDQNYSTESLNKDTLKNTDNWYKITVDDNDLDLNNIKGTAGGGTTTSTINLISTSDQKFIKFNILFTKNGSKITKELDRINFIFKTGSAKTKYSFKKPYECLSGTTDIKCTEIYLIGDEKDLGKNNLELTITNNDQIQTNKYYLMLLSSDVGEITNVQIKMTDDSVISYDLTPIIYLLDKQNPLNNYNIILS